MSEKLIVTVDLDGDVTTRWNERDDKQTDPELLADVFADVLVDAVRYRKWLPSVLCQMICEVRDFAKADESFELPADLVAAAERFLSVSVSSVSAG